VSIPEEFEGRKVRCSDCSNVFTAEKGKPSSTKKDSVPKREEVVEGAEAAADEPAKKTKPSGKLEPHRGMLILGLGIGSIVLPIVLQFWLIGAVPAILAWMWGKKDLKKMDDGEMDPEGRQYTNIGKILGLVGIIINALGLLAICAGVILWIVVGAAVLGIGASEQKKMQNYPNFPKQSMPQFNPLRFQDYLPSRF
jgi:hypothetical protein